MYCPKDKSLCFTKQLEDVTVDICPLCDGVWLDREEVIKLARHFDAPKYSMVDEIMNDWHSPENNGTEPKDLWSESKLLCPNDNLPMSKHYFAGSKVGVDQCSVCQGFWLDGGELHEIADYMKPDLDMDRAWQSYIKADNSARKDIEKLKTLPARIALAAMSPAHVLLVISNIVFRTVVNMLSLSANHELSQKK